MISLQLGPPHGDDRTADLRRQREIEQARRAGWLQLDRDDLTFRKYGIVEHRTGELYTLIRGETDPSVYTATAAWYLDETGAARFLERPPASFPQTADALAAKRAERPAPRRVKRV